MESLNQLNIANFDWFDSANSCSAANLSERNEFCHRKTSTQGREEGYVDVISR